MWQVASGRWQVTVQAFFAAIAVSSAAVPGAGPQAEAVSEPTWPIFRGDPALSGRAKCELPARIELCWSFKTGDEVKSSPVIGAGRVFAGSADGRLYALSLHDGRKIWDLDLGEPVEAPPLLADNRVFAGSSAGVLIAAAVKRGEQLWKLDIGSKIMGSANLLPGSGDNSRIVVGAYDNLLRCIAADTGEVLWKYEADNFINGTPAVYADKVVFGGCDALLHIVSGADGSSAGTVDAGSYVAGSAAIAGKHAYLGHYGNKLICVDLPARKVLWEYAPAENAAPFFSSPAIGPDRILAGSRDGMLHCVGRQDGKRLWTFRTRGGVDSSPVISGKKAVFGSGDGSLYVVTLADGKEVWSYETGAAITCSPAVAGGFIVIGADDGRIYAFAAKQSPAEEAVEPRIPTPETDGRE